MSERSVKEISDKDLVSRAVRNARSRQSGMMPRWSCVSDTFALGSTFSGELCRLHGLDPDEMVHGSRCVACNP